MSLSPSECVAISIIYTRYKICRQFVFCDGDPSAHRKEGVLLHSLFHLLSFSTLYFRKKKKRRKWGKKEKEKRRKPLKKCVVPIRKVHIFEDDQLMRLFCSSLFQSFFCRVLHTFLPLLNGINQANGSHRKGAMLQPNDGTRRGKTDAARFYSFSHRVIFVSSLLHFLKSLLLFPTFLFLFLSLYNCTRFAFFVGEWRSK